MDVILQTSSREKVLFHKMIEVSALREEAAFSPHPLLVPSERRPRLLYPLALSWAQHPQNLCYLLSRRISSLLTGLISEMRC